MTVSAVYVGKVHHARHAPKQHRFSYRVSQLYLDLDELQGLWSRRWLWSHERWNLASFRRKHFLGSRTLPLKDAVRAKVEEATGAPAPLGPVRLLTCIATLGYCFNPVSFYYVFEEDGTTLHSIIAEITNTPWKERYQYVLVASEARREGEWMVWEFDKKFHVSPFFDMDHRYRWKFTIPGSTVGVAMENHAPSADPASGSSFGSSTEHSVSSTEHSVSSTEPSVDPTAGATNGVPSRIRMFDAALMLDRRPMNGRQLRRYLVRHPFMTGKIHAAIYWQALRLWMKRVPFFTHPRGRSTNA